MSTFLPNSPPTFNRTDVTATVRALCSYARTMHENLDYALSQLQKATTQNAADLAAVREQLDSMKRTVNSMQSSIESLGSSYNSLSLRVSALEQKVN